MAYDILVRLYGVPVTISEQRLSGIPKEKVESIRKVVSVSSTLGHNFNARG